MGKIKNIQFWLKVKVVLVIVIFIILYVPVNLYHSLFHGFVDRFKYIHGDWFDSFKVLIKTLKSGEDE